MSAARVPELFSPLRKFDPLLSWSDDGWVLDSFSRWPFRVEDESLGARSSDLFREPVLIISLKDRSADAGAFLIGTEFKCSSGSLLRLGEGTGLGSGLAPSLSRSDLERLKRPNGLALPFFVED